MFPNLELDPCCNDKEEPNVIAQGTLMKRMTVYLNRGMQICFMNHPYSQSKLWISYAVQQYELHNNEMLLLIKLDISTKWFRQIAQYPCLLTTNV